MDGVESAAALARAGEQGRFARLLLPGNYRWMLFAYATALLLIGWGYLVLRVKADYEQTLQAERGRLLAVAASLQSATEAMFNDGIGAAVAGANEIARSGGLARVPDERITAVLQDMLTGGDYVRSLFLYAPGRFAQVSRSNGYESASLPPAWLARLEKDPGVQTWVGRPLHDRASPTDVVVPIAQYVRTAAGAGVWAGVLFNFQPFDTLMRQFGTDMTVMLLLSDDGTILVRAPPDASVDLTQGINVGNLALFKQAVSGRKVGTVEGYGAIMKVPMMYGYASIPGYDLKVGAGQRRDAALAPWREHTRMSVIFATAASVLVLGLTLLLDYFMQAARRREQQFRALFDNAAFTVMVLEGYRFTDANRTAYSMFGLAPTASITGMTPWDFSPERQPDGRLSTEAAQARIDEALARGATTFEWLHRRLDTGATFPAQVSLASMRTGERVVTLAVVEDLTAKKQAERELRESEQRYRALVDVLPEAVFVQQDFVVVFANQACARLVGAASPEQMFGTSTLVYVEEADLPVLQQRARRVTEQGVPAEAREFRLRRVDGTPIWVELQSVPTVFNGAPAAQTVMRDVTARHRLADLETARQDRAQRQSETLLKLATRRSIGVPNLGAALTEVCDRARDVLGTERVTVWAAEAQGTMFRCIASSSRANLASLLDETAPARMVPRFIAALRSERVIETSAAMTDPRTSEILDLGIDVLRPASLIAAPLWRAGEMTGFVCCGQGAPERLWHMDEVNFIGGIADQVTQVVLDAEREQALIELRALAGELMRSQDEERRRIGRDLHDSTGQTLSALEIGISRLLDAADPRQPQQLALLEQCRELANQCSTEIRTAAYLLHPPLLDELGLLSALRWLADGLRQRSGLDTRLELPDTMARLSKDSELTLFRLAQEALTNVQRHSSSPWVIVRLSVNAGTVLLEIEDAGTGTGTRKGAARRSRAAPVLGVGLAGMRERVRQVGGTFSFEMSPTGTRVSAAVPLDNLTSSTGSTLVSGETHAAHEETLQ